MNKSMFGSCCCGLSLTFFCLVKYYFFVYGFKYERKKAVTSFNSVFCIVVLVIGHYQKLIKMVPISIIESDSQIIEYFSIWQESGVK